MKKLYSPFLLLPAGAYFMVQSVWRKIHEIGLAECRKAPIPVISVGNISIGGTGKTPFVIYLVGKLIEKGFRPCVVSRGYKGAYTEETVVVTGNGSQVPKFDASYVGDEPFLLANSLVGKAPVIVGRDRLRCAELAAANFMSDVVVMDDGFQHLRLMRDADIVLLSGEEDHMFPLGSLREPVSALSRSNFLLVNEDKEIKSRKIRDFLNQNKYYTFCVAPVCLLGSNMFKTLDPDHLKGHDTLLVSAIANPHRFRTMAQKLEWRIIGHLTYRDHHVYDASDLTRVIKKAKGSFVVFTEKDWVKLPVEFQRRDEVYFLRIGIELKEADLFMNQLLELIKTNGPE